MAYCNYTSLIYWRKCFPTGNNLFHVTLKDTAMETSVTVNSASLFLCLDYTAIFNLSVVVLQN